MPTACRAALSVTLSPALAPKSRRLLAGPSGNLPASAPADMRHCRPLAWPPARRRPCQPRQEGAVQRQHIFTHCACFAMHPAKRAAYAEHATRALCLPRALAPPEALWLLCQTAARLQTAGGPLSLPHLLSFATLALSVPPLPCSGVDALDSRQHSGGRVGKPGAGGESRCARCVAQRGGCMTPIV